MVIGRTLLMLVWAAGTLCMLSSFQKFNGINAKQKKQLIRIQDRLKESK